MNPFRERAYGALSLYQIAYGRIGLACIQGFTK